MKPGQLRPVVSKTTIEGSLADFTPNNEQDRGKAGSQETEK
jgi:hypothetical protein